MTGVKAGVKGDSRVLNAPKTPEKCPPCWPLDECETANRTQTQNLINLILEIFPNSRIVTSRGIS